MVAQISGLPALYIRLWMSYAKLDSSQSFTRRRWRNPISTACIAKEGNKYCNSVSLVCATISLALTCCGSGWYLKAQSAQKNERAMVKISCKIVSGRTVKEKGLKDTNAVDIGVQPRHSSSPLLQEISWSHTRQSKCAYTSQQTGSSIVLLPCYWLVTSNRLPTITCFDKRRSVYEERPNCFKLS